MRRVVLLFVSSCPPIWCHQIMTERHAAKGSLFSWRSRKFLVDAIADLAASFEVARIGRSIHQQCPIRIAVCGELSSGERAEHDDAEIEGVIAGKRPRELRQFGGGLLPGSREMRQLDAEVCSERLDFVAAGCHGLTFRLLRAAPTVSKIRPARTDCNDEEPLRIRMCPAAVDPRGNARPHARSKPPAARTR